MTTYVGQSVLAESVPGRSTRRPEAGYSQSAGFVVTVIMDSVDGAGITAWKTRGADLRSYLEGEGER